MSSRSQKRALRAPSLLFASIALAACGGGGANGGAGGGGGSEPIVLPPPMDPIAPTALTNTDRFANSGQCAQCHFGGPETSLLHDVDGNDISPVYLWRSSMMANAARDPYYLALFGEELLGHGDRKEFVETTCTRCHAPAGSVEHEQTGGHMGFDELMLGEGPEANLGRDGVTCTLCHQIADQDLGKTQSFTGGFTIGYERKMFGPHLVPKTDPMQLIVNYTPTAATHVTKSELCATCHTVVVPIFENGEKQGDFLEQAPYLEWLNSTFNPGAPCGTCHLPTKDAAMNDIKTPIAKWPAGLGERMPFGQHRFSGGNAYMLRILGDGVDVLGTDVAPAEFEEAAASAERHLAEGPEVSILSSTMDGDILTVVVMVENHAGHKLPTAYPGRRMWIHLRAEDAAGGVIFESGGYDAAGSLVDRTGKRLDDPKKVMPHFDEIDAESKVQVYEAIAGDKNATPTHLPLSSVGYLKDNRLLPLGWSSADTWIEWIKPIGIGGDVSFAAGMDLVKYHIPKGTSVKRVAVELLYQTVRPTELEAIAKVPHPAAVRFSDLAKKRSPTPIQVAAAESAL